MKKAYYNGNIYTADFSAPRAEAFIVEDGQFSFVGKDKDLPDCDEKTDLMGNCVIPGLVDSHCHIMSGILNRSLNMLKLEGDLHPEELGNGIESLLSGRSLPEGKPVALYGIDLTKGDFSAKDIDIAISDRPCGVFSADGHALLLNTEALKALNITRDTADRDENSYFKRDEDGNPTGLVIEIPAMVSCMGLFESGEKKKGEETFKELQRQYHLLGYTCVFDAMTSHDEDREYYDILKNLDREGLLSLRVVTSFCYRGEDSVPLKEALRIMKGLWGDYFSENVFPSTLKMIADGTVEEHSALLSEPYSDKEGGFGSSLISQEEMQRAAALFGKEGFSIHIHAIGDRAVSRALDTLIPLKGIKGTRTIAHNQLYRSEDIDRMIRDGDIFFQTTPHWMKGDDYTLERLGKERYLFQFPVGTMVRNGVRLTFGSDEVCNGEASNPFAGMYFAIARGDKELCGREALPPESERIGREEALYAYTINGAAQLGLSDITGSISPGKSADFLVLDRDIITCPLSELKETEVRETCFRGRRTK